MTEWDAALASMTQTLAADLQVALAEAEAAPGRVYHDEAADAAARQAYYAGLDPDAGNLPRLAELVAGTHSTRPPYKPALEVYPWVDLHPDGLLRSLYTADTYTPQALIRDDVAILQARLESVLQAVQAGPAEATTASDVEVRLPFNCEHVVPQSWFGKQEPMRGDLHHLFACEARCNGFRGNTPYREFPTFPSPDDDGHGVVTACGKSRDRGFEPLHGKGPAARAVMYFALRYPDAIEDAEMARDTWPMLLEWHRAEPVTLWERHRNAAIAERQGNRNPVIDDGGWAEVLVATLGP